MQCVFASMENIVGKKKENACLGYLHYNDYSQSLQENSKPKGSLNYGFVWNRVRFHQTQKHRCLI